MGGILIIEDDKSLSALLEKNLRKKGFRVDIASSGTKAKELIESKAYEIILLDIKLPDINGLEILKEYASSTPSKFIVITGFGDIQTVVEAMRSGASDFIQKPFSFDILEVSINKVLKEKRLEEENIALRNILLEKDTEIVLETNSKTYKEVLETASMAAKIDLNVLIRGETGTGKEVIARYIHKLSDRKNKPFIVVDCASIPEHLFESELFGHEKGAYTGATYRKLGLVELANGGTLFLDEIGEVPLSVQSKLLRFVETRSFRRVGGLREIKVNVRIISATNRNLKDMVIKGQFRSDLLYRINTIDIEIPPLRERTEDIPLLINAFLKKYKKKITKRTLNILKSYRWPGNVRELKSAIERASLLAQSEYIDPHICMPSKAPETLSAESIFENLPTLKDLELQYISYLYDRIGKIDRIAKILGCSKRTVFRKLRELRERNGNLKGGSLARRAVNLD